MLTIFIPGKPQGKQRARSSNQFGKNHHYTPVKTRKYEASIRGIAKAGMHGRKPTKAPVSLVLSLYYPIPESWPQWKKGGAMAKLIVPTVKPDSDNVEKAVKDALNGVAWVDDCQVVTTFVTKEYRANSCDVGVEVCVTVINKASAQVKTREDFNVEEI